MKPERIWLGATAAMLVSGVAVAGAGALLRRDGLSRAGAWIVLAGVLVSFLPLLIGILWLAWEKIARRTTKS